MNSSDNDLNKIDNPAYSDVSIDTGVHKPPTIISPVIVPTNADYKRPASAKSFGSNSSTAGDDSKEPLDRNLLGLAFLSLHFFIGLLIVLGSVFELIWCLVAIFKPVARPTREINPIVSLMMAIFNSAALLVTFKYLCAILFSNSVNFRKNFALKKNLVFLYSSAGVVLGGLMCVAAHIYIYSTSKVTHLTPFLPAGIFLLLHGLLNLRLNFELVKGAPGGVTMMLPYKVESEGDDDEFEGMSDISSTV